MWRGVDVLLKSNEFDSDKFRVTVRAREWIVVVIDGEELL